MKHWEIRNGLQTTSMPSVDFEQQSECSFCLHAKTSIFHPRLLGPSCFSTLPSILVVMWSDVGVEILICTHMCGTRLLPPCSHSMTWSTCRQILCNMNNSMVSNVRALVFSVTLIIVCKPACFAGCKFPCYISVRSDVPEIPFGAPPTPGRRWRGHGYPHLLGGLLGSQHSQQDCVGDLPAVLLCTPSGFG